MESRKDWIRENIIEYLRQQNISWKQIKKDTGIDMENADILPPEEMLLLCSYLRREPEYFMKQLSGDGKEVQRIREVFHSYEKLFDKINAKVAFTLDNEAYFFRYNQETGGYDMFTRLESAEQLERIAAKVKV